MADSLLQITVALHEDPATVAERVLRTSGDENSLDGLQRIVRELGGLAARTAKVITRVDSVTRGVASQTVVVESDDTVAGDILYITVPGRPRIALTAVDTAAEVTAAPATGLWSLETATDTAQAQSLRDAIKAHPGLRPFITASESSGTVTISTVEGGTWGNGILIEKAVTTSGALTLGAATLTGGDDAMSKPSITLLFGTADIVANDTISIGAREYTWKASASADGEITLSTTPATAATNFTTAVNADANWTGLITATRDDATVTLTWEGDPRVGQHIVVVLSETNATSITVGGVALTTVAESFVIGQTVTGSSTTRAYGRMGITV